MTGAALIYKTIQARVEGPAHVSTCGSARPLRIPRSDLSPALIVALHKWKTLVSKRPAKPIPLRKTDLVLFFWVQLHPDDPKVEMIGGVLFSNYGPPGQFLSQVSPVIMS